LLGETGVGKEVIANAIHYASPRSNGPFIKVNCGAIPASLMDSELFGHEKGAFTGASQKKRGKFERADGGTIFLDEIGELPLEAQVRLLRVIQMLVIERVGGTKQIPVDIRIIAATHRDLEDMVDKGLFRKDLLFRLNVFPINIPPLRERIIDLPALVSFFIKRKSKDLNLGTPKIPAPGSIEKLKSYSWPGNIRELENIVERALIRNSSDLNNKYLYFDDLVPEDNIKKDDKNIVNISNVLSIDDAMINHIESVLQLTNGKIQGKDGAAALLGMPPSTLRNRMRKLGITFGKR
jgi:transcriptional regulator with GAF, ATPase, and Fis domain